MPTEVRMPKLGMAMKKGKVKSWLVAEGGTVEPLPFHAMKNFPYAPGQSYPQTPAHMNYQKQYNTRKTG